MKKKEKATAKRPRKENTSAAHTKEKLDTVEVLKPLAWLGYPYGPGKKIKLPKNQAADLKDRGFVK